MLQKAKNAIEHFELCKGARHITVALSGGADSVALLSVLLEIKDELGIQKVSAAHFNHKIRGEEAERDQEFVINLCESLGVELFLGSADVPQYARDNRLSVELAARQLRYDFLDKLETDLVATAHTASDNTETVIFNITRGTSLSGLCGIPPKRGRYIRPIIYCTRADVEIYCKRKKLEFVTDSTNLCNDYTRNGIRHKIVPLLKQINPSIENAVTRMSDSVRENEDFINTVAQEQYDVLCDGDALRITDFKKLHPAVAKRVIEKYYAEYCGEADNFHINRVYEICMSGGRTSVANRLTAQAENGVLRFVNDGEKPKNINFDVTIEQKNNDIFISCEKVHNLLLKNILDCDKIVGKLVLRTRQSGDRIRLKNKNGTKTLKKLYCEYKIAAEYRDNLPVLCDDMGVVWIHKIGVAERCAADCNSKRIYKITVNQFLGDKNE